jgi:hypothetical protein
VSGETKKYTGRCACGQVTYGFDSEPSFVGDCHCTDCKRAHGTEMSTWMVVPETDFTFSGPTKSFSYPANTETCAGDGLDRVFCTNCGSRVFTNNVIGTGIVYVQEGTLDRFDEWLPPQADIFTWTRQQWMPPVDGAQFDHAPS